MESTQCQYRLLSVKNKSFHTEKRTTTYTPSKKPKAKQFESQHAQKTFQSYSQKPAKKQKEHVKYQNYGQKAVYCPVYKGSESQIQGGYYPGYQYYPQYYMPGLIGYGDVFVPVYGYPMTYTEVPYEKTAVGDNSPQEAGYSGCPTVASEEDLNNLTGEECEFKVVCNGNLVHKECYNEQESDPNTQSMISLSDYEEFVLPFTELEPKSEAIPMPSFLAQ
jgi:hypothetical protein